MNPFAAKEVSEAAKASGEIEKKTKAFENAKSSGPIATINEGLKDRTSRTIPTINEGLEGKKYPGTDVKYKTHQFVLNGEKVEGVFPKFPSKFDTILPRSLRTGSDEAQFKYCTAQLAKRVETDPVFASKFTPRQLEQIKNGEPRISGLTWHHNEVPGKMQLVDSKLHETCRHTGGRSIWGGGSSNR